METGKTGMASSLQKNVYKLAGQAVGDASKFKVELEEVRLKAGPPALLGGDLHQELLQVRSKLINGAEFSPRELLLYQIRAGEFGLQVEMVSKLSEAAMSTVRKFQHGQ